MWRTRSVFLLAVLSVAFVFVGQVNADIQGPVERIEGAYKSGQVDDARKLLDDYIEMRVRLISEHLKPGSVESPCGWCVELCRVVERVALLETEDGKTMPFEAFRGRIGSVGKALADFRAEGSDETFLIAEARAAIGRVVRRDMVICLERSDDETREKIEAQFADVLKVKPLVLDSQSPLFIKRSRAPEGVLQQVDACYRMKRPVEGRRFFLEVLTKEARAVEDAVPRGGSLKAVLKVPVTMADQIIEVGVWERALETEWTKDQYFPSAGVPMLKEAVSKVEAVVALLPAAARQDPEFANVTTRLKQLNAFRDRMIVEAEAHDRGVKPPVPDNVGAINWNMASSIAGKELEGCLVINEFFDAMAKEDQGRLEAVLARDPKYATAKEVIAHIKRQKAAGAFERLAGYDVKPNTQYRFLETDKGFKANVSGLGMRMVVGGKEVSRTNSEIVDLIREDGGLKIGISKAKFEK